MKRRSALAQLAEGILVPGADSDSSQDDGRDGLISPFANRSIPQVQRTNAGLEPYTGPWTADQVTHLLRRATFGPSKQQVDALKDENVDFAVDVLLAPPLDETSEPLVTDSRDFIPVGTTWVNATLNSSDPTITFNPSGIRRNSLKAWWMGLILNQQLSIREKMVLFWHNHFVTETATVGDPRYLYRYVALLRHSALGNFKTLVGDITQDGAMLIYLNGDKNTKSGPDENYARELQELFTIGKGPLAAPGDYTNYTEDDVKAAARVLTGWRKYQNADGTIGAQTGWFDVTRHDPSDKVFSYRYNNTVIAGGTDGAAELQAMLDMIFAQSETAKFICRKLYRWFVYYVIDEATEANIISPLADILRQNNFEIIPVLSALLKSAHFFDPANVGCFIKSPLDMLAGVSRQFDVAFPFADVTQQYRAWYNLTLQSTSMDQNIGDPPNVAGWPAYYQIPEFNELWINSDTLPKRSRLTDLLVGNGYTSGGVTISIDPIAFTQTLSNPDDPNVIIQESAQRLFAITLTPSQVAFLKDTLLPGLPDYEWSIEWASYLSDPTNPAAVKPIKTKLQALYGLMLRMPEYQLM
jgi:uncharacterized protein (DUF1800 family)